MAGVWVGGRVLAVVICVGGLARVSGASRPRCALTVLCVFVRAVMGSDRQAACMSVYTWPETVYDGTTTSIVCSDFAICLVYTLLWAII